MGASAGLLGVALVLVAVLPGPLAAARWPVRSPGAALVLWQALGLAAGLLALELALTVALLPYGEDHLSAGAAVDRAPPWWAALAALLGLVLLARLLQVLAVSVGRTVRARRRLRRLVDLLATRNPLVRGASVLEHDLPVAYCLPGLRPRVVVSQGALLRLSPAQLDAVLAHERAHVDQRHDLVVLPFTALRSTLPGVPAVRAAVDEVALLVEMLADDRAALRHDRTVLASALCRVAEGGVPAGGLGAAELGVLVRADRLLDPPPRMPPAEVALVLAGAVGLLALPLLGLLVPLL